MEEIKFMMSKHFNKSTPEEFGLTQSNDPDIFISLSDQSLWGKRQLYDWGWGRENGFYRLPLPSFEELVRIVINSMVEENCFGAASIILDDYVEDLQNYCLELFKRNSYPKDHIHFFNIMGLERPINRNSLESKDFDAVMKDYTLWVYISDQIKNLKAHK